MEFLSSLAGGIWQYGIMFLLVLTLVVFIHELGHFLVARWCGVTVKAFSIGFGPEIFGFLRQARNALALRLDTRSAAT